MNSKQLDNIIDPYIVRACYFHEYYTLVTVGIRNPTLEMCEQVVAIKMGLA